jgi:hypothetical protein
MDMGSEHCCIPFLENLLSKLEKYKTIHTTRSFDMAKIKIGYDEFILQCLSDGSLKVSITMKRDDSYYDAATEYIKAWQDMDAFKNFIVALAVRYNMKTMFIEMQRKRSADVVKSAA